MRHAVLATAVKAAKLPLPANKGECEKQREQLLADLKAISFRNWPSKDLPLDAKLVSDTLSGGKREQVIEFTSEENIRLRVTVGRPAKQTAVSTMVLLTTDDERININDAYSDRAEAFVIIHTRGIFSKRWDEKTDMHIRRRCVLVSRSFDDGRVWDTLRAIHALREAPDFKNAKIIIEGVHNNDAGVALYAGLFEPAVEGYVLDSLPTSHRDGPTFLNAQRVLDLPQAVALAFPRQVTLTNVDEKDWSWTATVAKLYGDTSPLKFRTPP